MDRSIAPSIGIDSKEVRRPRRDSTTKCGHAVIVVISCAQRTLRSLHGKPRAHPERSGAVHRQPGAGLRGDGKAPPADLAHDPPPHRGTGDPHRRSYPTLSHSRSPGSLTAHHERSRFAQYLVHLVVGRNSVSVLRQITVFRQPARLANPYASDIIPVHGEFSCTSPSGARRGRALGRLNTRRFRCSNPPSIRQSRAHVIQPHLIRYRFPFGAIRSRYCALHGLWWKVIGQQTRPRC